MGIRRETALRRSEILAPRSAGEWGGGHDLDDGQREPFAAHVVIDGAFDVRASDPHLGGEVSDLCSMPRSKKEWMGAPGIEPGTSRV
jgi:hypothetical protein